MDPTKPILDLYSDSGYEPTQRSYKPTRSNMVANSKYTRPQQQQQRQISYSQLKQKYQELYQAYSEKVQRSNTYEDEMESMRVQNNQLREQLRRLQDKNEQLNATLLNKNVELEEAYRQLQEDIRRGHKVKKNDDALDRLEQGTREAIVSNFNLLREAVMSQLKHY